MIPVAVKTLDCSRANGAFVLETDGGERIQARDDRRRQRRTLPPSDDRRYRPLRGPRDLVLGVADRSAPVRRRRGRSGRRRQFGRSGRGVSLRPRLQSAHDGERAGLGRKHVALPDRSHRRRRPNIELMTETEIVALSGASGGNLERVRWRDRRAGRETEARDPQRLSVRRRRSGDRMAARLRGAGQGGLRDDRASERPNGGPALSPLESSVAGVFAVGDVRSGSVKRVGGAIGEGAAVVAAIHKFLAHSPGPHL